MSRRRTSPSVRPPMAGLLLAAMLVALSLGAGLSSTSGTTGTGFGAASSQPSGESEMASVPQVTRGVMARGERHFDGGDRGFGLAVLVVAIVVVGLAGGVARSAERAVAVRAGSDRIAQDRAPPGVHRN